MGLTKQLKEVEEVIDFLQEKGLNLPENNYVFKNIHNIQLSYFEMDEQLKFYKAQAETWAKACDTLASQKYDRY